jgi:hypothetical protein
MVGLNVLTEDPTMRSVVRKRRPALIENGVKNLRNGRGIPNTYFRLI